MQSAVRVERIVAVANASNQTYIGCVGMERSPLANMIGMLIFVALIGSHVAMWARCRR